MNESPLAILASTVLWLFRIFNDAPGAQRDLVVILTFGLWAFWLQLVTLFTHFTLKKTSIPAFISISSFLFKNVITWRNSWSLEEYLDHDGRSTIPFKRPLIFPCRTAHTRMFPKKHSFSYSYLVVGIPIGWRGSVGSFLSADLKSLPEDTLRTRPMSKSWFNVEAADHLNRGTNKDGLKGKLDTYLESQLEDPKDYASTYLITAPRFLGYSFNPVSFWYLYNERRELKAMILEVNNTFDERRMYFLKDTGAGVPDLLTDFNNDEMNKPSSTIESLPEDSPNAGREPRAKFTRSWIKDFHVSPFNSRKGSYSLVADDPFSPFTKPSKPVNNTITLNSSKSHTKLIARVFSTSESIDPSSLSQWKKLKFLVSWCWVGFVTFPRIVREAGKLFFKRKLHVWYRPEVLRESIGRHETSDERAIAQAFRSLLYSLVEGSDLSVPVRFESGISTSSTPDLIYPSHLRRSREPPAAEQINIKVTTPLFYARLARHANTVEFLTSEIRDQDEKTQTFYISRDTEVLISLFASNKCTSPPTSKPAPLRSRLRWSLLLILRKLRKLTHKQRNTPQSPLSSLDTFMIHHSEDLTATTYRRAVLKLLASDFLAFGIPEILDVILTLTKLVLFYTHIAAIKKTLIHSGYLEDALGDTTGVGAAVMGLLGTHLWWVLGQLL